MSDNNVSQGTYGLDSPGRIVRIGSGITRSDISRIEETLRRVCTNLRREIHINESNNENGNHVFILTLTIFANSLLEYNFVCLNHKLSYNG